MRTVVNAGQHSELKLQRHSGVRACVLSWMLGSKQNLNSNFPTVYNVACPVSVVFLYIRCKFSFSLNSNFSRITCSSRCQLLLFPKLLIWYIFQTRGLAVDGAPNLKTNAICLHISLKAFRSARVQLVVESRKVMKIFCGRWIERWSRRKKNWNKV